MHESFVLADRGRSISTLVPIIFDGGNPKERGKGRLPQVRKVNSVATRPAHPGKTPAEIRQFSGISGRPTSCPELWFDYGMIGLGKGVI